MPPAPQPFPLGLRLLRWCFHTLGELTPRLTASIAYRLWFRPGSSPVRPEEIRVRDSAEQMDFPWKGKRLAVWSWGVGPAVLLVHGWGSHGTRLGGFVEPLVRAGYRVITFDAPGHGRSPGRRITALQIADAITALGQALGPFEGIITHSFGGICTTYALRNGLQAKRIVCLSPPAHFRFTLTSFAEMLHLPVRVSDRLRRLAENEFGRDIWSRLSMDTRPEELSLPALVIHDEDDLWVPVEEGQVVAAAWPQAEFVRTQGLGGTTGFWQTLGSSSGRPSSL